MEKNPNDGLSARQQTIYHPGSATLKTGCSFTIVVTLAAIMTIGLLTSSCQQGQSRETAYVAKDSIASSDSVKKPDVKIQVNRRYDDKGNLIGFDSTYSSFYSNVQGDTVRMDSLMKSFDTYFGRQHSQVYLRGMMHRMDSIKNRFYKEADKSSTSKRKNKT